MTLSSSKPWLLVLACLASFSLPGTAQKTRREARTPGSAGSRTVRPSAVAFVGVDVVSTADASAQPDQTVIVRNGVIHSVGDVASTPVPWDAVPIVTDEGEQLFLMSGLADVHTHESVRPNPFDKDEPNNFLLYLVNGVTTILNLGDYSDEPPIWAERLRNGELDGPTLYTAHFIRGAADGGFPYTIAETPEAGRQLVQQAKQQGYDMVKVYNSVSTEVFDAVVSEAEIEGMAVVGHGVRQPGMDYILNNGMSMVAHAEEFIYTSFGFAVNDALVPAVADMVQQSGAYVTGTLSAYESISEIGVALLNGEDPADYWLAHEGVEYLTNARLHSWQQVFNQSYSGPGYNLVPPLDFQKRFLKAFHDEGVPLLIGTDAPPIPGVVPGHAALRELELFVEAGLSPAEALHAGTANAGAFFSASLPGETPFGMVVEGYRADLLLLRENPLLDVSNVRTLEGVMARGRWYSKEWIAETRARMPITQ